MASMVTMRSPAATVAPSLTWTATTAPGIGARSSGSVAALHVADGATVAAGDRVVTIEAMKMEHPVLAPHSGVVRLDVVPGEQVRRDQVLAHVSPAADPAHVASAVPPDLEPTS